MFGRIETAELTWQHIDGIDIPVSTQFGDVYFSKDNGLLETRHVFLAGNDLDTRLSQLTSHDYFTVAETGFGTGLNILALWQLWQRVRPDNQSHLHAMSVEKYPLTKHDLTRALAAWPELKPLADSLLEQYPQLTPGCHRLHFPNERFSLDLWLGDAEDIFPLIHKTRAINAWFLDGFAPSCNPELWQEHILKHVVRLSGTGTTFASFSVAGILKRGLTDYGVSITRPKGFGHKRQMLKGIYFPEHVSTTHPHQPLNIAIVGAGIAGLTAAWAFAQRGCHIQIFEQHTPLSGASGNPLALLNPKLCPISQAHKHLMVLSWQYALAHYSQFNAFTPISVQQSDLKHTGEFIVRQQEYPKQTLTTVSDQTHGMFQSDYQAGKLNQAGYILPEQLKEQILQHPKITLHQAQIASLKEHEHSVVLESTTGTSYHADRVISCVAEQSQHIIPTHPTLKPIRGQVSWFKLEKDNRPDIAYSYGGYIAPLSVDQLIIGASFQPNCTDKTVTMDDHQHNLRLIQSVYPHFAAKLPELSVWQGRASLRAQTADYLPVVGSISDRDQIYTFSGLGSKGFLFAPLCAELLVAEILGELMPMPVTLYNKLSPRRFQKKVKPKKPYYRSAHQ
ncbi:FAD-dependent 5-carboxymethylaminomethyl-2-thiouridine(34) oxidoreductase MnmC [Acinetobacter apis]|uniref:tRNA 5-methylaminomethyl-2-thiouridine biosynthesis bifunctional protein MnmC n=1 Tax=Acinetobacter apis TaxID=1229165 RepID=A0A217EI11_9GAMM|nr:FAD-dependent 5-carboxymethylaminomethyl-2-thiouridine(34) oxidoreductase MnmC [Acinetobacter apis]SNQ30131.1 tRNA 5-methylaminomethyl-2-thiouridine biosynthesis bifunctional protein [Acinetobacter apis]